MTNNDFLDKVQSLWQNILSQRRYLIAHAKGFVDAKWATEKLNNLENAKSVIKTAEKAKEYIEREKTVLKYLIPAKNQKLRAELQELIETQLN